MTADGEQTGRDAERTNVRADSVGEFIKALAQDAEGIRTVMIESLFLPTGK